MGGSHCHFACLPPPPPVTGLLRTTERQSPTDAGGIVPGNSPSPHSFPSRSRSWPWQGKPRTGQETSELSEGGKSLLSGLLPLAKTFWSKELALQQPLPPEVSKEKLNCFFAPARCLLQASHHGGLVPPPHHGETALRASHSRSRALRTQSQSPFP